MNRIIVATLAIAVSLVLIASAPPAGKLTFPVHQFSISPLESKSPGSSVVTILFLPPSDQFAPNVNVLYSTPAQTADQIIEQTRAEMGKSGLTLLSIDKTGNGEVVAEYKGSMSGRDLHWYVRANVATDDTYIVTATALEKQWADVSPQLKACVDSFSRDPAQ